MTARDEILARLHKQKRDLSPPPAWLSRRDFDDLADQFEKALTAAKGEVLRAADLEEALDHVTTVLQEIGAETAVADNTPPLGSFDPARLWPNISWHAVGQSKGDLRAFSATADIGLSGADAALAETGTVVVSSGQGRSRLTSLLPPVHLALVPTSILTTDIFTWTAERQGRLPASMTLISGPSKTADIEQTMAVGVHGPKRFIVVLYEG